MGRDPALVRLGWFDRNSGNRTHAVKGKAANGWGLYDLHGNVWEWCLDGRRDYGEGSEVDALGPLKGARRCLRGGSWISNAENCRSAYRYWYHRGLRRQNIGFRLAASGQPAEPGKGVCEGM